MDKQIKGIIVKSSLIGLIGIALLLNIILSVRKFFRIKENKIVMILAKFLAKPLYKNEKETINEILEISMMTDKIYEITISSDNGNFKKAKSYDSLKSHNYSYEIKYKNKNAGLMNIVFKK